MNRRRVIPLLAGAYFALQLSLLWYWHSLASPELHSLDTLATLVIAVALGAISWYSTHYLLQALSRTEKVYAQDMSRQLERSLQSYRQLAEREERRTQEIGRGIEAELAQARKDLAAGRLNDAARHLQQGLDISSDVHRPACANAAVAAIVEAKTRECTENGVRLTASIDLPAELGLADMEVASLLFNLVDNALHECVALRAEATTEELEIELQGRIRAGQLFIRVSNPCRASKHAKRWPKISAYGESAHGWGTDIVQTVARSHGGISESEDKDGVFTATVMIPVRY